jgi:HEAT repeat protein
MTIYPNLTISLLSQLTDRELQSNYLNHLDRTSEITSLLAQITDSDLALRIVNLALEVDLSLGASLTGSIEPELQKVVVDRINSLEIPTRLKISLWHKTKSKTALPYLQDIFIFNHQKPNTYEGHREIESATSTIIHIDRDLAVSLLLEELNHPKRYDRAAEILVDLAPVEAIEALGDLLQTGDRRNCRAQYHSIQTLVKIGTEASISKLRDILNTCKHQWSDDEWIQGLGYIANPAMVEHLINLLYEPELYTYRSTEYPGSEEYYANEADNLCCAAIKALERIGQENVNVFDWLHQLLYWISNVDEFRSPFQNIVRALFNLDEDRILTAIESAIESYDPIVRKRAAMALVVWDVTICDRNLSILLNAIDDLDLDVQIKIVCSIREIIHLSTDAYVRLNITPELIDRAILETKEIVLKYIKHPDLEIRERVISQLSEREVYEWQSIDCDCNTDTPNLSTLIKLLHDPEIDIQKSAVTGIVELGSVEIFPILLELANKPELVATLIWGLQEYHRSGTGIIIFEEFNRDREITMRFLESAEKSLIQAIENNDGFLCSSMFRLSEIGSDRAIPTLQQIIKSDAYAYYDEPEDALRSLATISTDAAKMALIQVLTERPNLGCSVFDVFSTDGKLGLVPQLWLAHRQNYVDGGLADISKIQEREGLYNPEFSDRSHPLFESPRKRLRHILLGDTELSGIK